MNDYQFIDEKISHISKTLESGDVVLEAVG